MDGGDILTIIMLSEWHKKLKKHFCKGGGEVNEIMISVVTKLCLNQILKGTKKTVLCVCEIGLKINKCVFCY